MKKHISAVLLILLLFSSCSKTYGKIGEIVLEYPREYSIKYQAEKTRDKNAVWFSYLDYEKTLSGLDELSFTKKIESIFEEIKNFGFNTVIFQVRSHSDVLYSSALYPASAMAASELGNDLNYDPLFIAVDAAHKLDLKIEAWINPLRAHTDAEAQSLPSDYIFKEWYSDPSKNGNNIVLFSDRWYYNPAVEEVRSFIASGVREICENYDVDGIHIDDYFYPTTDESFDKIAFEGQEEVTVLADFRRNAVSEMVKAIYNAVKETDTDIEFGVSPQGNISNCYNKCYADVSRWCSEDGFLDYIAPQIYYSFEQDYMPFNKALSEWQAIPFSDSVKFCVGLAAYKLCGKYSYSTEKERLDWSQSRDMLYRQVKLSIEQKKYNGFIVFSYSHLFLENDEEIEKEKENLKLIL